MKNENVTLDEAALVLKHTVSFYTGDSEKWARFLRQSAFLYKYDIINQFLIANYSYGRNVTAAASESEWKRLKASVNENAEGIPVVKKNNEGKREISYVYDISDTDSDYKIWQPDKNSTDTVKTVSNYFKASGDNFKAAVDNSILDIAGENFSPTDKEWNDLIVNSIKYIVYTRCGLDTDGIAADSLSAIQNFHSVDTTENLNFTLNSLNKNILRPAENVLRGIERSVIAVDRQKKLTAEKTAEQVNKTEKAAEKNDIRRTENSNIIGNTVYRYIANKTYRKIESSLTSEISKRLEEENIKFSGKINSDNTTTLTFNRQDLKAVQQIIGQAKNKGRFFTDEEITAAKTVSLVDYLGYRGENLKRVGNNEYTLPEHDSMRISENKYYWNSRSKGGNAVDFCMNYYNMTFQEAVKSLLDYGGNMTRVQPQTEKQTAENSKAEDPAKLIPFPLSEKTGRVFKYLTESRGLSSDMVNSLINEGKIAQDINGNAVFKVFDKNGELNGSEVSGTSQRRYKQTTGLDGNGFTVNPTGTYTPEKAIFFESAIDLLSYYELHKDETALLISMGGLKDKTVLKVMEDYNLSAENCLVAIDNDEAGAKFTNKMKNEYNINAYPITEDERFNLHENIKDWNDLLKAEKEDKTEHLTAYHTTNVDFDTFKPGYRGVIWTEKNLDFAKSRMAGMGSDRIFTCEVTMKNPKHITYDSGGNWDIDRTIRKARSEGYDGVVIDFKLADEVINNSLFQFVLTRNLEADARDILYSIVKANASDAMENETLKDFFDRVRANNYITHSYVAVFKPEQVKIINKTLINEQPEIISSEQENETNLKNAFNKALQNHETFYIKYTEENFENYRIAYDDKENHYNVIADRIYPIAKIRESNIIEESLAADIDADSVIDIIKSYDSEISSDNLKTADQIQQERQLAAQAEQTVINNFMKNYINSDSIFCPNLDLGEFFAVTNELFYYENSTHNVNEKIIELAAKYRNGEDISTELSKHLDCETHIKIDADEERYDAGLPNDKDLYADIFVTKDENGLTFKFGDTKRFCTWEEYGKGQFEYLKESFRSRILSEYADEETAPPQFNSYGEELPEPEREMPKEQLDRLLARLDGKELTANLVGEFYEFYGKDAQAAAEVLGFKLTHKKINGVSVPMVGFPKFAFADNERKLMNSGYTLNVKENTGKINAILSAAEKYNPLYFKDNNVSEQYISDARRSVFKYTRLVNDNGNYRLVANRISPSLALDVVLYDFVSLNAAAEYAEANNFEIDYELSEREKSAQIEWNKMKKENESLINNNIFEYQGYHFKPVGNFKANADFNSLSRSMRSHSSPYMSVYEDSKISYSHEDFYRASNNSTADVFLCAETGKAFSPAENELFEFTGEYEPIFSVDKSSLPFAVGDSIVYADGLHERLWKVTDIENFTVTLSRKTGTFLRPNKETESFDLYNDEDTIYVNLEDVVEYFNDHYEKFNALKTALENHEPVYLIGNEEILHNPRIEYADGFRIASDDEYGGIHARRLVNMDVMSIIKYIKDEEYRVDYSRLGLTKTVDLEVEESEPEVSEKEVFAPEYIYKMEVNPKTTGRENLYFIQSYLTKEDGKADIGDILYVGTPEKCQEFMEKLNAGELMQDEVKEIYRKSVEQAQKNSDKDSFSVYQLNSGDETRYHRYTSYDDLQKSGLSVDNSNYNLAYKAPIEPKTSLENIFFLLNTKLPEDFKGHSLSVSDIIVLHKNGQDKAYYVDSVGFKEVPEFLLQQEKEKDVDEVENNENSKSTEESSIHFGLLGNGITVYDVSREKDNDYLTVAHISDEGVVKYYVDDLKETDKELIQKEADRQKTAFTEKWNELSTEKKYDRILAAADTNQLVQITGDMISTEDRVKKYEHSVIFKDEDFPKDFKSSIIGNTPYRYIPKKQYKKISNDSDFTNSTVEKIGSLFENAGIKYSGIIRKDFTTITFSKNDIEKVQPIIDSVVNQKVEAIEENAKIEKKAENTDVENNTEEAAQTITQADIDSVLSKGSGFQSGKYRIYRQFQKQEKSKVNADFLRDEYGIGGGTHIFPDDVRGWSDHNGKGITIRKYGTFEKPDVKMNWSQVEKQIKKLIFEDRYFTDEDNTKYPEFLKSVNAPQYEIDNFIKSIHQKYILSKNKLPPAEKRDSLALRLSDFIRDLDGYEKGLLKNVDRTDLADVTADEMEKHLNEPETVQQLMDFLKAVQWGTSDVYYRGNSWYFRQELAELFPVEYVCKVGDLVFMDSEKYEVLEAENNRFLLQNVDMPLDRKYVSNEKLQEKLKESTQNDDLKAVKIPKQAEKTENSTEAPQETSEGKLYIPIYKNTGKYAAENGETDLFRASNKENRRCREAIEKTISENFDGMHLDPKAVVGVVEQFGVDRVSYLLAATIKAKKDYDKRFSDSNIKWANTIDTSFRSKDSFSEIINSHSTILDEFTKQFREGIEKNREIVKPLKEKAFEDIAEDVNNPVEYFTPTVKAVINDLNSISGKRYNVQIWSSTNGKNYTNTGNGRYFNDLDRAKSFAAEIIEGKYDDIIAFTAKYDEIYKELSGNPEKLNEYKVSGEDFDETVNNDSYNYYLKYISVRGDDFVGDREQTAFVLALNEISRQKNLDISETQEAGITVKPEPGQDIEITVGQAENFHITDYDLGVGSPKEKYNRNIEAIKTLFKIENENRQATPEEQEILSKYVGWGGLPEVFDSAKSTWHNEYEEVKSLLSDSEYRAAKSSTLNAHYTTPLVISSIYKVLESAGFTGGKLLEPAMGIGNFFGLLPDSMKNSELYGVELDSITGRIAKQLYPNADIQVMGFEKTDFDSGFFDAAVGNVPFGNYRLYDEEFHDGELIHDFFFKKSLDKVRPGGLVAFVTSKGTLDKADTKVREYLAQRADLLGAIRLPNTAFKKNANTEVTADILFLKKRKNLRDFEKDGKPEWTETTTTLDGLPINSYFVSHPQMVLGEMKEVTRRYGKETACLPFENKSLDELLEEAVSELGKDIAAMDKNDLKNVVTADTVEKDVITENENIKFKEIVIELNKPFEEQKEAIIEETESITENDEPVIEEAETTVEEAKPIAEPPKKNIYPLDYRNFCYCNIDGDIYYRENKNMEKQDFSKKHIKNAEDRVKGMIEISGCLQELIRFQKENYEDGYIIKQQNKLNELYNNFTEKYGLLSDKSNRSLFLNDDTYPLLQSLENINSKGELESKADIFTKRTIVPYVEIDSVDTATEALAVSISEKAGVDIDFMARLCSKTNDEVINDLEGVIFKNPLTEKYETSDEYLSGNVREKLRTAEIAAKKDSSYNINVSFLKEAQPKDLTPEEISVQLGSTWVPTKYYEQFMYELLDTPDRCQSDRINTYSGDPFKSMGRGTNSNIIAIDYNNYSATYAISNKENYKADKQNFKAVETYGTGRINAYKIIEDTLNMKTVKIVDYFEDVNGKMKAVPNEKETILAQEKQALIKSKFREWIFDDVERTADLCKIYNEKFNSVRPREYSGKHINFVGMNPEITLKEHQKNAIAHTLYGGNTLLAHSVGAGKTYEMVASAMESKRLGLCTKSLIVVPKHIVNQTAKEFLQLYPAANILVPNENDFTAKNRQKFCSRISTGNYDAIIISHNQFEKIPLSIERQISFIEEEIDEITKNLEMLKNQRGERGYTVKDLERTRKNLENTLETLNNNKKRDTVVTFEELGVDKLYVDEVQAFKNLFLVSKMGRNVAGINTSSRSQRATDLYMKCQYLDEKTGSNGTVFATGTPLSNSMTELYTMQKYLQQDELKARGLNNFDSWASCFGETQTALELAPEGKGYQMKTRFSRFFNLPELMSFFKETADIKVADELNLPVPKANFHNIATEPSRFQQDMVSDLAVRAKRIRDRQVRPEEDNMLKVTNDGRKLALDQRIANPLLPDDSGSKVNVCIENVFDIWKNTAEEKSTQLIFCDLSTPGGTGFNVYNDIKNKLIDKGVPSEEVAFIHDCKTDKQKQELFTKVNNGEVRVLLGSTSKMGTGTNCQQRLKALHHIDCPYRPSDLQQRNGRIIRQGNSNKEVDIYSYVTKGTFDSYIYQLLENKQKFISQIMTSKSPVRSAEDVDETVLSYSQIKALAAGDPKIKEKMDLDIDLARLRTLFADYQSTKRHLQNDILNKYPADIKQLEQHIEGLEKDIALGELTKDDEFSGITIYGKNYTDKKEAGTALISACRMFPTDAKSREIGEYRGFKAILSFDSFTQGFNLTLKNAASITVPLGQDPYGNFTRLNNAIANLPKEMETHKAALENTMKNLKNAKEELTKPFARIDELHEKEKRLAELNKELTMSNIDNTAAEQENEAKTEETKSKPIKTEYSAVL